MKIGIDGSRAFIKNRTGIEEYSYQVIKHLTGILNGRVVLYVRKTNNLQLTTNNGNTKINDLELPKNWQVRIISFPRFWTQIGLSLEMLLHPVDALFVPAHTVPIIHPKNTVVVIHGLEYEFCAKSYSLWDRIYMRASIKNSCSWASRIISVSENTKKDLINLYKVSKNKIEVIYEGWGSDKRQVTSDKGEISLSEDKTQMDTCLMSHVSCRSKFLLFIGRIEERKNIVNIIKAFEILKERYDIPHKLVLAGKPGFGYQDVKSQMSKAKCFNEIVELGFVSEQEKWELLKNADVFVFPTLYEGFGIPVLEAQSVGCSVVASDNSSIPEVVNNSAVLVNPQSPEEIAQGIYEIVSNESLKNAIIAKGLENVKRFSWEKCSNEIAEVLLK